MKKHEPTVLNHSKSSDEATLWQFQKVIDTGDVRYLLNLDSYDDLPDVDMEPLTIAWGNIYAEFSEITGGNRAELFLTRQKRLVFLKVQYEQWSIILRMVEILPHPDIIKEANEFGFNIDLKDFKATFQKAKSKHIKLKHQISIIEKDEEVDEKPMDFDGTIVQLEKYQGYHFDPKMTVKKFAHIYKQYKDGKDNV